jgi:hypothetical protein
MGVEIELWVCAPRTGSRPCWRSNDFPRGVRFSLAGRPRTRAFEASGPARRRASKKAVPRSGTGRIFARVGWRLFMNHCRPGVSSSVPPLLLNVLVARPADHSRVGVGISIHRVKAVQHSARFRQFAATDWTFAILLRFLAVFELPSLKRETAFIHLQPGIDERLMAKASCSSRFAADSIIALTFRSIGIARLTRSSFVSFRFGVCHGHSRTVPWIKLRFSAKSFALVSLFHPRSGSALSAYRVRPGRPPFRMRAELSRQSAAVTGFLLSARMANSARAISIESGPLAKACFFNGRPRV